MFSLRTLFLVVSVAALGAGAFVSVSAWLVSAFVSFVVGCLVWAAIMRRKPFWRGMGYGGWAYLLLTMTPTFALIGDVLPTTLILRRVVGDSELESQPQPAAIAFSPQGNTVAFSPGTLRQWSVWGENTLGANMTDATYRFVSGQSIFALLIGSLIGLVYEWHEKQPQERRTIPDTQDTSHKD